jgi:hypothetical protein
MSLTGTVVKAVSCNSSFVSDRSWMRRAGDTEVRCAVVPSIHVQEWSTFRFAVLVIFLTFNATSRLCPDLPVASDCFAAARFTSRQLKRFTRGFAGPPARVTVAGLPAATTTRMFQLLPAERFHHWLRWEIESLLERFKFRLVANRIQKWINL